MRNLMIERDVNLKSYEAQLKEISDRTGIALANAADKAGIARSTISRCTRGLNRLSYKSARALEEAIRSLARRGSSEDLTASSLHDAADPDAEEAA